MEIDRAAGTGQARSAGSQEIRSNLRLPDPTPPPSELWRQRREITSSSRWTNRLSVSSRVVEQALRDGIATFDGDPTGARGAALSFADG